MSYTSADFESQEVIPGSGQFWYMATFIISSSAYHSALRRLQQQGPVISAAWVFPLPVELTAPPYFT